MAVFSRIKTWVSNEVLTASDLNAEFNNLLNNTIPASIEDYSADVSTMQSTADPGGVGTESLPTTLAGELTRLRYVIKRIINQAQWYVAPIGSLSNLGILTANINDLAVTTAKINDLAVTKGKLAALGQQVSSSSGTFSMSSTSYADVTNLTVTITTTGRPVLIFMQPDGSTNSDSSSIRQSFNAGGGSLFVRILRGASVISQTKLTGDSVESSPDWAPSSIYFMDVVAAGTYTYKIQIRTTNASAAAVVPYCVLAAYEI